MSEIETIPYFSGSAGNCPLCRERCVGEHELYFFKVCTPCRTAFKNRRQVAFLIDLGIVILLGVPIELFLFALFPQTVEPASFFIFWWILNLAFTCIFMIKDGFSGYSPGKAIMSLRVIEESDTRPITIYRSFKRNYLFLFGLIPIVGDLCSVVLLAKFNTEMGSGSHGGDRFGHTRVIWNKYASSRVFGGSERTRPPSIASLR